jgi:hypothetical protein
MSHNPTPGQEESQGKRFAGFGEGLSLPPFRLILPENYR